MAELVATELKVITIVASRADKISPYWRHKLVYNTGTFFRITAVLQCIAVRQCDWVLHKIPRTQQFAP